MFVILGAVYNFKILAKITQFVQTCKAKFSFLLNCYIFEVTLLGIWKTICNFATEMSKNLYIISGCNDAGKTTASYTVLPEVLHCRLFMNEVDSWEIYDNSAFPTVQIAKGGKDDVTSIIVESTYKK